MESDGLTTLALLLRVGSWIMRGDCDDRESETLFTHTTSFNTKG